MNFGVGRKLSLTVLVLHTFNPSTGDRGRQISVSSRPVWSTDLITGTKTIEKLYLKKQTNKQKTKKEENCTL